MTASPPDSGQAAPTGQARRRSDAADNRARIIEVARAAFTSTPDATLQSIAKAAEVGQGTMYRNFPSREALLLAVYRSDVEALAGAALRLLDEHPPMQALRLWFDRLAAYSHIRQGASQAIEAATRPDRTGHSCPPIASALEALLNACKHDNRIRPDAETGDVLLLTSFLWKGDSSPDWQERTARTLEIVIDGLRSPTRATTPQS